MTTTKHVLYIVRSADLLYLAYVQTCTSQLIKVWDIQEAQLLLGDRATRKHAKDS